MRCLRAFVIGFLFITLLTILNHSPTGLTWAQTKPFVKASLRVFGGVSIAVRPYDTMITPSIRLRNSKGEPVSGMVVKLGKTIIPEVKKGHYRLTIKGYRAAFGNRVSISISPTSTKPRFISTFTPITATATVGRLAAFLSPVPEARINLSSIRALSISWTAGNPPYELYIYELKGKLTLGTLVFERVRLRGTSISVPASTFNPTSKYGIYLMCSMGNFSFKGSANPGSRLVLRYSVGTYINTE